MTFFRVFLRGQNAEINVSWKERRTNALLYQNLPKITTKIKQRRMRLAGHCIRHTEEIAHHLVLWEPTEGRRNRGKPKMTYIDNLLLDADAHNTYELRMAMLERDGWRAIVDHAGRPGTGAIK